MQFEIPLNQIKRISIGDDNSDVYGEYVLIEFDPKRQLDDEETWGATLFVGREATLTAKPESNVLLVEY